jgi:hypothetical protein
MRPTDHPAHDRVHHAREFGDLGNVTSVLEHRMIAWAHQATSTLRPQFAAIRRALGASASRPAHLQPAAGPAVPPTFGP